MIINPHLRSISKQLKLQTNSYSECAPQDVCLYYWMLEIERQNAGFKQLIVQLRLSRSNLMRCCTVTHTHRLQTVARTIHHAQIARAESFSAKLYCQHCFVISP